MVRSLKRNKRGSLYDLIFIGVILLSFAVGTMIAFKISSEINAQFQASGDITTEGKTAYNSINNMYPGIIDNSFLLLTMGLSIFALILAMMVRIHPVFFVFYLILLVIVIFMSGVFSNIYLEMANNPEMLAIADQISFTTHIMAALPFIVGVIGFILAIVMYKNWRDAA